MQLVTGPPGSGKTSVILDGVRQALRAGNHRVRLLTPTATLARHFRHSLAREGFVFPAHLVETLHTFVTPWAGGAQEAPGAVLHLVIEDAVHRLARPEFAGVARFPGFYAALAETIADLSSAGCDSARLETCLPPAPLGAAFLAVYREVDRELARRGLALRGSLLERAAGRIEQEGSGGIEAVWLDGFHALPDPELRVIAALGRHCELTLALGNADLDAGLRPRLQALGFVERRAGHARGTAVTSLMRARSIEREVEEIARQILEQAAAGRPFREIGIVVRTPELYVPLLRSTLERFGIPARFSFDARLPEHAVTRFLAGAVNAMLGGWDHEQTLAVLRLEPRFADSRAMDAFDFAVREQIPNSGLGALKGLLVDGAAQPRGEAEARLMKAIDALGAIEEWRSLELAPADWAARLRDLRDLFRPAPVAGGIAHEEALLWRSQAAVLKTFGEALDQAALALADTRPVPLTGFWRAAEAVLRIEPLRPDDDRRNVVHVLPAPEARQWVLPIVFVCGLVEKQFPRFHPADSFFPDAARAHLQAAGVRVRTAADFERGERALFDSALGRATILTALSYPEFDTRGESNLPSHFLDSLPLAPRSARAVRPAPRHVPEPAPAPAIHSAHLLEHLRRETAVLAPTRIEMFLACPFQYFAARTLRLAGAPPRPEDRLDFIAQGDIVHKTLKQWYEEPRDIAAIFDEVFERECAARAVPAAAYHTERLRNCMLEDLRAFILDGQWPRGEHTSQTEKDFQFAIDSGLEIKGRIDRIDTAPDGRAYVLDYKYSTAQRVKARREDENLLQPALYMLGAREDLKLTPAGMFYVALKGKVVYQGWSDPPVLGACEIPPDWYESAAERTRRAAAEIRSGVIAPRPADRAKCDWCDFKDVCRIDVPAGALVVEHA